MSKSDDVKQIKIFTDVTVASLEHLVNRWLMTYRASIKEFNTSITYNGTEYIAVVSYTADVYLEILRKPLK